MTRLAPVALLSSIAIAGGCAVEEPAPAPASTLHVQGGVLSTDPATVPLDGDDRLRPVAPGGAESLWVYEIIEGVGVAPVDVQSVEIRDGAASLVRVEGNHVSLRAASERASGWIEIGDAEGRTVETLLRVVPVAAAVAAPGGAWTDGDPLLASSPFVVWSGGQVSVALLADPGNPDFRVLDHDLAPVSRELIPTSAWDAFEVEAEAGRHSFAVRSGGDTFAFDVDVVETIDRLEVIAGAPPAPGGVSDQPFEVCLRARAGDAIVTGAIIRFELEGDGALIRYPNTPANCARVELSRGAGAAMLRASLSDESMEIAVPAR